MSAALQPSMTRDDFLRWAERQETRHEFDGLHPVAMTGGTLGHSQITGRLLQELNRRLAGTACVALGPDAAVATANDAVRYPDVVVTCSPFRPGDNIVPNPVIVIEVVSPGSGKMDRLIKLREYNAVPTIRRYILVESDDVAITVLHRDGPEGPFQATGVAPGEAIPLPELGIDLPVDPVYDNIVTPSPDAGR